MIHKKEEPVINRQARVLTGNPNSRRISFSKSLKRFCIACGISYKSPHKLRNGHGVFAVKQAENIEEFKAYSQNMMHESMEITDRLYGRLSGEDVKAVVKGVNKSVSKDREAIFEEMLTWFETTKKTQNIT